MIMRWRSREEQPKSAQKDLLAIPKTGNVNGRLGACQHRKQAPQQHLFKRIHNLGGLPNIRQIQKMLREYDRLAKRTALKISAVRKCYPLQTRGSAQIQYFNRLSRTHPPDYPALG